MFQPWTQCSYVIQPDLNRPHTYYLYPSSPVKVVHVLNTLQNEYQWNAVLSCLIIPMNVTTSLSPDAIWPTCHATFLCNNVYSHHDNSNACLNNVRVFRYKVKIHSGPFCAIKFMTVGLLKVVFPEWLLFSAAKWMTSFHKPFNQSSKSVAD